MRTTKNWKRIASAVLACLLSVGSAAAIPTVYAEEGTSAAEGSATYSGAAITRQNQKRS